MVFQLVSRRYERGAPSGVTLDAARHTLRQIIEEIVRNRTT